MIETVAAKSPRGPIRDVDGALVRALRYECDLSIMKFGSEMGVEKVTAYRWEVGGVSEILFLGMLSKLGKSPTWTPKPDVLERAEREIKELRAQAAARDSAKAPPVEPAPKKKITRN